LVEFTSEDLRIMISQGIGLPNLVPLALETLEVDPLAESDFYPGDLLAAVFSVDDSFWTSHAGLASRAKAILGRARASLADMEDIQRETIEALRTFESRWLAG
jgi:hypothetical protein